MAEKRVSVRLVAEGGRQVRAELEGIGDAGARGFGRLSSEMELANTRLASFARKAGIALAAVTVAAAAAGVAMVRSGLETIGAQADMAASLKTTVESLQVLTWAGELAGVSMGEIEQATKKLTTRLSEAAAGSGSAVGALQRLNLSAADLQALPLDQRIIAIQEALNRLVPEAERAAVASDLFGDKAALAFLRIDPATLREAAQDVRDFGVAVSAADAAQIERTGDAIAKLSLIWLGLTNRLTAAVAPALEVVANALADAARGTGPIGSAITALFDNIGRLTTYAATFAALVAGRWVAGLAAAALSVRGLATGLVVLRGALIRTGIGALIVGAGELVFQFTRLVAGAGGFGAAIGLLKDLALEVWDRIGLGAASAWSKIEASWAGLQATIYGSMQSSVEAVTSFGNSAAGIFKGAYDAVKAIWGKLPGAIGDFAFQAANGLIGGVEAMLNGVVTRINNFIEGLNAALDLLPDWAVGEGGLQIGTLDPVALGRIDNPFAGSAAAAGTAAAEAFSAAMAQTYVITPDLGLTGMADDATARAEAYREASGMLADAAARPMQSWQALKDADRRRNRRRSRAGRGCGCRRPAGRVDDRGRAGCRWGWCGSGGRGRSGEDRMGSCRCDPCRLRRQGPQHRRRYRERTGLCLYLCRERCGRVRKNRQAGFPRLGHLDDRRSGQAGGTALHPGPHRQRALRRAGRRGWHLRQHPACRWHCRISGPGPRGLGHGLRRCPTHAFGRLGRDQTGRGACNPAAR